MWLLATKRTLCSILFVVHDSSGCSMVILRRAASSIAARSNGPVGGSCPMCVSFHITWSFVSLRMVRTSSGLDIVPTLRPLGRLAEVFMVESLTFFLLVAQRGAGYVHCVISTKTIHLYHLHHQF